MYAWLCENFYLNLCWRRFIGALISGQNGSLKKANYKKSIKIISCFFVNYHLIRSALVSAGHLVFSDLIRVEKCYEIRDEISIDLLW